MAGSCLRDADEVMVGGYVGGVEVRFVCLALWLQRKTDPEIDCA